jgi:POT family proton-dependent oligopeptide transporter
LFGHPKGLSFLFATEMWERFSYYGMRALLVLYMVEYLLKPENAGGVLGLAMLKRALELVSGPLGIQPLASLIYGLYTGLVYLTPVLGGFLADRWVGRTPMVIAGAMLMVAGHFMMAFEHLFLLALVLLILGNGAFKPNISTQVGDLYAPDDPRRDRAYSVFYVGINVGAFFSPLVCGTLGENVGWHYGFASAGIGMAVGLAIYLAGLPRLPKQQFHDTPAPAGKAARPDLRKALAGLLMLLIPSTLFWAAYEQQGNTIALWIEQSTDRRLDLLFWHGEIPASAFQAINPLMIFAFTPPLIAYWARRARAGREPSTIAKMAFGCVLLALAYLAMAAAAWSGAPASSSMLWLLLYFAILTMGELYFSPISLSLVANVAPNMSRSTVMGIWLATSFLGNIAAGWIGSFWSTTSNTTFFLLLASLGIVAAGAIHFARPMLRGLLPGM